MKQKLTVGQDVYVVPHDTRLKSYHAKVKSIGKKYITVTDGRDERFYVEDWFHENSWYDLYVSEEDYKIEQERKRLLDFCERKLSRLDYVELRTVEALINNHKN